MTRDVQVEVPACSSVILRLSLILLKIRSEHQTGEHVVFPQSRPFARREKRTSRAFQSLRASSSLRQWQIMSSAYLSKGMEGKLRAIHMSKAIVQEQISQDGLTTPP